ncbi:MAG: hypothetical protein IJT20_02455 [Synergistaceae bacterium]|nr:hypothetical protein [Synergistaceae bacterium]
MNERDYLTRYEFEAWQKIIENRFDFRNKNSEQIVEEIKSELTKIKDKFDIALLFLTGNLIFLGLIAITLLSMRKIGG